VTEPAISIGMPVYDGERYLEEALDSLLGQSCGDFNLVISDNASTDNTEAICREYAGRDRRIRYVRLERNIGGPRNWNHVVTLATAPYFKWASANDVCHRDLLRCCKEVLDAEPNVVLAYPRTNLIDEHGNVIEECNDVLHLREADPCDRFMRLVNTIGLNNAQAGLIRTEVLRRTGLEGVHRAGDIPLMAELAILGEFHEVPERLFYRRMAPDATTCGNTDDEWNQFNDPVSSSADRVWRWPYHFRYFAAVRRAPLTLRQKARLYRFLARHVRWDRQGLWRELRAIMRARSVTS